jgi:hypothetical protein
MVGAELTSSRGRAVRARVTDPGPLRPVVGAYAAGWALLVATAFACAVIPHGDWFAEKLLGLPPHARIHPAPPSSLDRVLSLFAANIRATCWPLIAAGLRAWRFMRIRWAVHAAASLSVAVNLLPVGAALGIYGLRLVPYLPQLPLELYAVTSGAQCWRLCCDRRLTQAQLVAVGCSMLLALAVAAALEGWGVPHRRTGIWPPWRGT